MSSSSEDDRLIARFLGGERRACARLITLAESGAERFGRLYDRIHERVGGAHRIGITGPPGGGKSTLIDALVDFLRRDEEARVGVVAIDPSSPFSGGALLGDRVRMGSRPLDPRVFIRSMATRGGRGGLAQAAVDACDILDAWGARHVLLESVGAGQLGCEIERACDTTVVVVPPGSGDSIQAMKAGLLESADVFVVNKADRPGAERTAADLEEMLALRDGELQERIGGAWRPPVLATAALEKRGIAELARALGEHREFLRSSGRLESARQGRLMAQVRRLVDRGVARCIWERAGYGQALPRVVAAPGARPYALAAAWLGRIESAIPACEEG